MRKVPERVLQVMAPLPPIRMGMQPRADGTRLEAMLTVFLRVTSTVWFAEGAMQWLAVLSEPDGSYLGNVTPQHVTAMFFFCILDFVAAVGLWLVSTWGVAVWFATILGHVVVAGLGVGVLANAVVLLVVDVVLAAIYATLVWFIARARSHA